VAVAQRRQRQKAELRRQILDAARAIVVREGFGGLSMRKIAEQIEYSPGTIYLHFSGRDELAHELCREGFVELLTFMAPALAEREPLARLRAIGRRYVEFGLTHQETYRMIFMEDPKYSTEILGLHKRDDPDDPGWQAFGLLRATIEQLVDNGTFRAMDANAAAEATWAWVHGIVSLRLVCPESLFDTQADELLELATETLVRGYSAAGS